MVTDPIKFVYLVGDGVTTDFSYAYNGTVGFDADVADDVKAAILNPDGTRDINPNFAVMQDTYGNFIGKIRFAVAPVANAIIYIYRATPQTQETEYKTSSGFDAQNVEKDFDKLTKLVQETASHTRNKTLQLDMFQEAVLKLILTSSENQNQMLFIDFENLTFKFTDFTKGQTVITPAAGSDDKTDLMLRHQTDNESGSVYLAFSIDQGKTWQPMNFPEISAIVNSANAKAQEALTNSEQAVATANDAKTTADGIDAKATQALENSEQAVDTANDAKTTADGIDAKATQALENSEQAVDTANDAKTTADGIDAKATQALENSEQAVDTANDAKTTLGNKITNCILEIPQNINLTLDNGTLTLKAGSKTYMPRAGGGFDELVTTSDITYTHPINGEYLLFIESQGRWVSIMETEYCFSGTTEPEKTGYKVWYDTGTNIINYYNANNVAAKQTFPIAKVTVSGGQISSIDAVFNGFGFIGGSVFSFPGLKVAVPNGRNPDGTLNNSIDSQTQVLTTILPNATRTKLWANASGIIAVNDETTSDYGYTYDERLNIVYSKIDMQRQKYAHIADLTLNPDDNLQIIDINPKYPIRATDYWDFNKLVNQIAGKQDTTGLAKIDLSNVSAEGIDTAVGWGMPDYSAGVNSQPAPDSFTCDQDYLFVVYASSQTTEIGNILIRIDDTLVGGIYATKDFPGMLPIYVKKGSVIAISSNPIIPMTISCTRFPLLKGA